MGKPTLSAQKILDSLYEQGRISFSEKDLIDQSPSVKKVLYTLGAYKQVVISHQHQNLFGIREMKKLIDSGYNINNSSIYDLFEKIFTQEINNIKNIFETDISTLFSFLKIDNEWSSKKVIIAVKSWKSISKGKDLRLEGFGKIDIMKSYNIHQDIMTSKAYFFGSHFPSVNDIRAISYFPNDLDSDGFSLERVSKLFSKRNIPLLLWVKQNKFPLSRFDELQDAIILDFFKYDLNLKSVLKILDNMIERDLRLTWRDQPLFDFSKNKNIITKLEKLGLTIPKNGIELKKQGKRFKNCAGTYVNKIDNEKSLIAYNERMMLEIPFNGGNIRQAFGNAHSLVSNPEDLKTLDTIREMFA